MFDAIFVGGGAAGFYGAIQLAHKRPQAKVAIFERGKQVLSKVKISGGGRCNVTHADFDPKSLSDNYPRGQKELLGPFHKYMTGDVFSFFAERGVPLKTESDGRVFPQSNTSQSIIDCFLEETRRLGITVMTNCPVREFKWNAKRAIWRLSTTKEVFETKLLMLSTGSSPKIWEQLAIMGHTIIPPVPSLFTFNISDDRIKGLQGLSTLAKITIVAQNRNSRNAALIETGQTLITHWGLSGPAILRLSAWGAQTLHQLGYQFKILVNWMPEHTPESLTSLLKQLRKVAHKKTVHRSKIDGLPNRLWQSLVEASGIPPTLTWAAVSNEQLDFLKNQLIDGNFKVTGKSTFKEEFVTAGGVSLKEIDFKSFKSKKLANLYLAGEIIDVDAITGGFNFQNAWTGAFLAAQHMAETLAK